MPWLLTISVVSVISAVILTVYFYFKKYMYLFIIGLTDIVVMVVYYITTYNMLNSGETGVFYIISNIAVHGMGILVFLGLAFSPAKERRWLKTAGIAGLFLYFITLSVLALTLLVQDARLRHTLGKVVNYTIQAEILIPLFYILNFFVELKELKDKGSHVTGGKILGYGMGFLSAAAVIVTIISGYNLAAAGRSELSDKNKFTAELRFMARPFEERIYVNPGGDTLRYRLLIPRRYDPEKKYPLVLSLHGSGGTGKDNIKQILGSGIARVLSGGENRKKYPAFVMVPQCPRGQSWGGYPGRRSYESPPVVPLVMEAIDALEAEFSIDKKRRYISGESMGGYGTWHFIVMYPEKFAAAIPIAGYCAPELAPKITGVAIWVFHGKEDRSVPVRYSRDIIKALKKAGGDPRYTEYPNRGHGIWWLVFDSPEVLNWLFEQTRDE
jgi:predicted esterase